MANWHTPLPCTTQPHPSAVCQAGAVISCMPMQCSDTHLHPILHQQQHLHLLALPVATAAAAASAAAHSSSSGMGNQSVCEGASSYSTTASTLEQPGTHTARQQSTDTRLGLNQHGTMHSIQTTRPTCRPPWWNCCCCCCWAPPRPPAYRPGDGPLPSAAAAGPGPPCARLPNTMPPAGTHTMQENEQQRTKPTLWLQNVLTSAVCLQHAFTETAV